MAYWIARDEAGRLIRRDYDTGEIEILHHTRRSARAARNEAHKAARAARQLPRKRSHQNV